MNRAMVVTVLWRLDGQERPAGSNPFLDVPSGRWFTEAVLWASGNGIAIGVEKDRFAPYEDITREQMATFLYRFAKLQEDIAPASSDLSRFPDEGQISRYAREAIAWAVAENLLQGSAQGNGIYLLPKSNTTRAQCAAILHRFDLWLQARVQQEKPTEPTEPTEPQPTEPDEKKLRPNPYPPESFTYQNGYPTCEGADTLLGVDVSQHQGEINWRRVKAAGMDFAMVRMGYRGYSVGNLRVDSYGKTNLRQARDAGLKVGAYFFSQAINPEEARQEAKFALEILEGYPLDLPLVYDWEFVSSDARTGKMNRQQVTACAIAFCQIVEEAGYRPMVYFNQDMAWNRLNLEELCRYDFWFAQYSRAMTFPYAVDIWQYTETGLVDGIPGRTDINLMFLPQSSKSAAI